jgi:hypothetical protein
MSNAWIDQVASIYRATVADLTQVEDNVQRKTAFAHTTEKIVDLVRNEELSIPLDDVIHAALMKVDERDGGYADAAIKSLVAGQNDLEIEGSPMLSMVVTLGRGKRKVWRDFTVDDLAELDRLRYQNVASVKAAYDEWRADYEAIFPGLLAAGTVGQMVAKAAA